MPTRLAKLVAGIVWMLLVAIITFAVAVNQFPRLPVSQPLAFNHVKHQQMACVVCHRGVETLAHAGLPDIAACLNCHAAPPVKTPTEVAAWNAAVNAKHMAWRPVTRAPDHVYFSHRRHVDLGRLDCAGCHGDIAARTTPPPLPLKPISMNDCTDCHRQENVSLDCARCHK